MTDKSIDEYLKAISSKGGAKQSNKPELNTKLLLEDATDGLKSRLELFEKAPRKENKTE